MYEEGNMHRKSKCHIPLHVYRDLTFCTLVFTSREERHFDVRRVCVKIDDCWFIQQLNRCFSTACYVPDSGLGSEDRAGSFQQ